MIRIAITPAAYAAIAGTLALGTVLLSQSAPRAGARREWRQVHLA
jgi:hypothetical protein